MERSRIRIRIVVVSGDAAGISSYPEYSYSRIGRGRGEDVVISVIVVGGFQEGRVNVVQEEEGPSIFVIVKVLQSVDQEIYA